MSLAHSRVRARHPGGAPPPVHTGAWRSGPHPAAAPRRFFRRSSLVLVAGGAVGGMLVLTGSWLSGAAVGVGTLVAAPFVKG